MKTSKQTKEYLEMVKFGNDRFKDGINQTQKDIKLARQCMDFKNITCDNKNCLNKLCPLQKSWDNKKFVCSTNKEL